MYTGFCSNSIDKFYFEKIFNYKLDAEYRTALKKHENKRFNILLSGSQHSDRYLCFRA